MPISPTRISTRSSIPGLCRRGEGERRNREYDSGLHQEVFPASRGRGSRGALTDLRTTTDLATAFAVSRARTAVDDKMRSGTNPSADRRRPTTGRPSSRACSTGDRDRRVGVFPARFSVPKQHQGFHHGHPSVLARSSLAPAREEGRSGPEGHNLRDKKLTQSPIVANRIHSDRDSRAGCPLARGRRSAR